MNGARLPNANLIEADLTKTDLTEAGLHRARIDKANADYVILVDAVLQEAKLTAASLQRANLTHANLSNAELSYANLNETDLMQANLKSANLDNASLRNSFLTEAALGRASLVRADLTNADLTYATFDQANLAGANISHARCYECRFNGANLAHLKGAHSAKSLETTHVTNDNDAKYFESCIRKWPEKWIDWERIRTVGRWPLFGISYSVLILIPFFFYGLAFYNDNVELIREWASQSELTSEGPLNNTAQFITERLKPLPIPQLSLVLLGSTVLLAFGSTLYTFFCPSRIKEFSVDVWRHQLGHSLLHYWPLAWKWRTIRLLCAACYLVGG